jgi:uncharacterized secreted protein with C-terminal beta-propeller domain
MNDIYGKGEDMDSKRLKETGYFKDMNEDIPFAAQIIEGAEQKRENRKKLDIEKRRGFKRHEVISMLSVAACLLLVFALIAGPLSGVLPDIGISAKDEAAQPAQDVASDVAMDEGDTAYSDADTVAGAEENVQGITSKEVATADKDYANIYEVIEENSYGEYGTPMVEYAMPAAPSESPSLAAQPDSVETAPLPNSAAGAKAAPVGTSEFSDTNIQVEGVQEADIVKTDGTYIYAAGEDYIYIILAGDGHPKVVSKIDRIIDDEYSYSEMFLTKDRLILIRERAGVPNRPVEQSRSEDDYGCIVYPGESLKTDTSAVIYDISDKTRPMPLETLTQSGEYVSSRMIGDQLYLLSSYYEFYSNEIDKTMPQTFVPNFVQGNSQKCALPLDITVLPGSDKSAYTVISAIDTKRAKYTDNESVFGGTPEVYSSRDNMYLAVGSYSEDKRTEGNYTIETYGNSTLITKVEIGGGQIKATAQAEISGYVNNQFSMDEYDGVFRIVATGNTYSEVWETATERYYYEGDEEDADDNVTKEMAKIAKTGENQSTTLYTLDKDLKELGRIGDIAPDERIYSARFMGDIGYFVTFRETDPLFSVDLHDPKNPKILGELKIPGFSEYLQSWSDNLLFGFGNDADEDTGAAGSLKLKMFNVKDPSDVREDATLLLDDLFYSEASYNHKAILADPGKGIIAFPTDEGQYIICSYSEKAGFKRIVDVNLSAGGDDWYSWYASIRGLFIGDVFYVVHDGGIFTYDMNDGFKNIDRMVY